MGDFEVDEHFRGVTKMGELDGGSKGYVEGYI